MAIIYLRSTDGSDADNGSTWALAKATLVGALAIAVAGDTIYVSQVHAETLGTTIIWACPGTVALPVRIICANDGAEPPTAVATTATITTTGSAGMQFNGSAYIYGITFSYGSSSTGGPNFYINAGVNSQWTMFEQCKITSANNSGSGSTGIYVGEDTALKTSTVLWRNVTVSFPTNSAKGIAVNTAIFHWDGGGLISGTSTPAALMPTVMAWRGSQVLLERIDLSLFAATFNIFANSAVGAAEKAVIRNSKLPAAWSGAVSSSTSVGSRYELYNCDSGATNYKMRIDDWSGNIYDETTIVRSGGATDGTTPISWRMVTSANVAYPQMTLNSPPITLWNDTTGSTVTVTLYGIWGGGAVPLNDEIWIEVRYPGSSAAPLGTGNFADTKADILATAANQDSDGSSWGGSTTAFKMVATLSAPQPGMKGPIYVTVKAAKASSTFYIDPKIVLT